MSKVISAAVEALSAKLPSGFDGVAKFVITGEGAVIVDNEGVREGDDEAEVTLTASVEVFQDLIEGNLNPTTAFMTGKLKVDGALGMAMKLGAALS